MQRLKPLGHLGVKSFISFFDTILAPQLCDAASR